MDSAFYTHIFLVKELGALRGLTWGRDVSEVLSTDRAGEADRFKFSKTNDKCVMLCVYFSFISNVFATKNLIF